MAPPRTDALWRLTGACLLALLAAGCAHSHGGSGKSRARDFLPGSRELARLDMLVGHWEARSDVTMDDTDETVVSVAHVDVSWGPGGQYLVKRTFFELEGGAGDTGWDDEQSVMGIITWDSTANTYRTWHFDGSGWIARGTMRYDETTRTWYSAEEATHRVTGHRTRGEGSVRYVSDDEKVTRWTNVPLSGQRGGFTTRGTSRRTSS